MSKTKEIDQLTAIYDFGEYRNARLGAEIKVSPKSICHIHPAGAKLQYFVETVTVSFGIGKDNTGYIILPKSALDALRSGEKLEITTTEQWKKLYENPIILNT